MGFFSPGGEHQSPYDPAHEALVGKLWEEMFTMFMWALDPVTYPNARSEDDPGYSRTLAALRSIDTLDGRELMLGSKPDQPPPYTMDQFHKMFKDAMYLNMIYERAKEGKEPLLLQGRDNVVITFFRTIAKKTGDNEFIKNMDHAVVEWREANKYNYEAVEYTYKVFSLLNKKIRDELATGEYIKG